jgi:hypothetical protein
MNELERESILNKSTDDLEYEPILYSFKYNRQSYCSTASSVSKKIRIT